MATASYTYDPSELVYRHLPSFAETRRLHSLEGSRFEPDSEEFEKSLAAQGYYRHTLESADKGARVELVVFAKKTKYTDHGPQLKDLLNKLRPAKPGDAPQWHTEVILIAPNEVLSKKNILDVVKEANRATPKGRFTILDYSVFSLDYPRSVHTPQHVEKVEKEELQRLLTFERKDQHDYPAITSKDPLSVWYGLQPGDFAKVLHTSEPCGQVVKYYTIIH